MNQTDRPEHTQPTPGTPELDIAAILGNVARWLGVVNQLASDPTAEPWRNDDEPGYLRAVLLNVRSRAEAVRFAQDPARHRELRLLVSALPAARLRQLEALVQHDDEAA